MCASSSRSKRTRDNAASPGLLAGALCALAHAWLCASPASAGTEVYRIDPVATRAEFAVAHFWFTTLHGRFARTQGTIALDPEERTGSIDFVIDADSVDTGWSIRDDFIRGEHMFDASRFPRVRFRSTELRFGAAGLAGASGELTLHNVTRPVVVTVERMNCGPATLGESCGVAVGSRIRRSDFGLTFGLPFVGDEIDLSFDLTARRVQP